MSAPVIEPMLEYDPSSQQVLPPFSETWTEWQMLPDRFRNEETVFMLLDQNGRKWDLAGPNAGRQGAQFGENIKGLWHSPFVGKWSEGAYQIGSTLERIDYPKREINFGIILGRQNSSNPGTANTASSQYRMMEERWWSGWRNRKADCFLGCYTRTHGWRWIKVRLSEDPKTTIVRDPVAHQNNLLQWDMTAVAALPFWCKRGNMQNWSNSTANVTANGGHGFIHWVNRGDFDAWPKYLITATQGTVTIQDGLLQRYVQLAPTDYADGYILYDTDPTSRIATSENEPIDNIFFEIIRSSTLLDYFLGAIAAEGQPVWQRLKGRAFASALPPKTTGAVKVTSPDPTTQVFMIVPQHYDLPYA